MPLTSRSILSFIGTFSPNIALAPLASAVLLLLPITNLSSSRIELRSPDRHFHPAHSHHNGAQATPTNAQDVPRLLSPGQPIPGQLKGGDVATFRILISSGQFLHVAVEQQGINLVLKLIGPEGSLPAEMDSPNNTFGPEHLSLIAKQDGECLLEVRSKDPRANPGSYVAAIEELRPSKPADETRVSAERSFMEAEHRSDPTEAKKWGGTPAESFQKAIEIYLGILPKWRAVGDTHGEVKTFYRIGQNYNRLGKLKEALDYFNRGLAVSLAPRDWRLEAGLLNEKGIINDNKDENDEALKLFERARPLFDAKSDRRGLATTHNNIAHVLTKMGRLQDALQNLEKALVLRRAENDQNGEVNVLNNIGGVYDSLGNPTLALKYYSDALKIWRETKNLSKIPIGLNNVAVAYDQLGEWQKAIENYKEALTLYRQIGDRNSEAITLDNIGDLYESLNDPAQALAYYTEALKTSREVGNKGIEANILAHLGQLYTSLNRLNDARESFVTALDLRPTSRRQALIETGLGAIYAREGNSSRALEYYARALKFRRDTQDRRGEAVTLDKMGQAYVLAGEPDKALATFNDAVTLWKSVEDQVGLASSLAGLAGINRSRGNLKESLQQIEEATNIVESSRTKVTSHKLRTSYFASKHNYYELHIGVLMDLYRQNRSKDYLSRALLINERSRVRTLIDILGEARIELPQNIEASILSRHHEVKTLLKSKAAALTQLLNSVHTGAQIASIKTELSSLIAEDEDLQAKIRSSNPNYASITGTQPLDFHEVQNLLDADTVLLEYALGERRSYVWAVTREAIEAFELPDRASIEALAHIYRVAITRRDRRQQNENGPKAARPEQTDAEYAQATKALGETLLNPVAAFLNKKRLVIVADGGLQAVPFSALPVPNRDIAATTTLAKTSSMAKGFGGNDATLLIQDHEILGLPSISVLAIQRREIENKRKSAPYDVAVLANPVFDQNDARVKRGPTEDRTRAAAVNQSTDFNVNRDLTRVLRDLGLGTIPPPLFHSREEADSIRKLVPKGKVMLALDFKASRAVALSPELSQYRIIHFATHSVLDLENPELSGIILSMVDEKGKPQDGYLRLHDIYQLNLPADLVVLSACETGVGKQVKGEGLIALTRGFMYAGATQVIASLWKVDDAATADLMARFYREMFVNRLAPAAALREAQNQLRKTRRWRSPFYWAGFVVQGDWK